MWWGNVNVPIDEHSFEVVRERARDYLNICERLYCFDGFAGWDPKYRFKVRVICERPYHALFMHTMLIRPTREELASFGKPDFVIYNAGRFPANRYTAGMGSKTSICLDLEDKQMVILGTEYAGEMKKGVFTVMNYFAPKQGVLSMHCSATADKQRALFPAVRLVRHRQDHAFGRSHRLLIGDDEHCWSDEGVFNIEGGCYAKAIDLTPEIGARHLCRPALRSGAGKCGAGRRPSRRLRRHQHHREYTRRVSDRVHPAMPRFPASPIIPPTLFF